MNDSFNCGNRLVVTFDCRGLDPVNRDGVVGAEVPHLPELVQLPEVDEARLVRAGPDFLVNLIFLSSVKIQFHGQDPPPKSQTRDFSDKQQGPF